VDLERVPIHGVGDVREEKPSRLVVLKDWRSTRTAIHQMMPCTLVVTPGLPCHRLAPPASIRFVRV
jgi:hypothetical protein